MRAHLAGRGKRVIAEAAEASGVRSPAGQHIVDKQDEPFREDFVRRMGQFAPRPARPPSARAVVPALNL